MKTLQKFGGIAALYMAISHLIGIVIFIVILDVLSITDPAQKLAMNIEKQTVIFSTNLLMYVFFGFALIVLSLALYDRMKSGAPALMQVATAIGIVWGLMPAVVLRLAPPGAFPHSFARVMLGVAAAGVIVQTIVQRPSESGSTATGPSGVKRS